MQLIKNGLAFFNRLAMILHRQCFVLIVLDFNNICG
jgi:hypothetical protein